MTKSLEREMTESLEREMAFGSPTNSAWGLGPAGGRPPLRRGAAPGGIPRGRVKPCRSFRAKKK